MTTTLEHPPAEKVEQKSVDICAILSELGASCRSKSKFYREALQAIAKHFGSPYAAIRITHSASSLDESVCLDSDNSQMWELAAEEALLDSQAENGPIARLFAIEGTSLQVAVLAIPVREQANRSIGALSVIVRCESATCSRAILGELAALVSLIETHSRLSGVKGAIPQGDDTALKQAVMKATDFESLDELAFAITNSLKNKFACDQVVLGQVVRGNLRILSISGLDNVYPKSPGVKHFGQAMEECLDHAEVICCQEEDKWSEQSVTTNHCLHRRWHAEIGNAPVASVPLLVGEKCVAVLGISRSKKSPFTRDELAQIRETVTPFAPAMMLVAKADRGLIRHATDMVEWGVGWLLAPHTIRQKGIIAAILASIAIFCFVSIGYEVTVPIQIAPTEIRFFAAPFEGTIEACHVDVGAKVVRGQLLYEMDTTDLQLQYDKLESELAVLQLRVIQAFDSEDVKSATLAEAEMRVVQTQMVITRHHLDKARVRAPADGTIVLGELSKRIGEVVPMGAPLLEFVPEGNWSIELLVPEMMATEIEVGFEGRFACNARPGEPLRCKIARIQPTPEPLNGKNVFIAEATVEDNPAWMLVGMEGTAHIEVGQRPVWWVALHRMIDYVHLKLWI
jgi:HlyD family secretion protein/biotin/lipoyl-binding protein/GAF domain-containing protein